MSKLRAIFVVPALGLGLACTAILNPRDDVQRCGSASDCESSGDNRYDVVCVFPEDMMLDSTEVDKICVAEFAPISCNPESYIGTQDHPLVLADMAFGVGTRYACADEAQLGLLGCPPTAEGACTQGTNVGGVCLADDAVSLLGDDDFFGQDVLDQFCRSFFCDDTFVCDRDSGFQCIPCQDGERFGNGGCGTVFIAGQPSCIYTDPEADCAAPESDVDEPRFGACM